MEYYQRNLSEKYRNSGSSHYYDKKSGFREKENLFKEIYSIVSQFSKMLYEVKRELKCREMT